METNNTVTDSPSNGAGFAATPELESALDALSEMNDAVVQFVREQPVICMVAALGVGFALAKIADRF